MKHIILAVISIIIFNSEFFSQSNIEIVLNEVEKNNTMLSAHRKKAEADKIENKTGIYLQNPEIEFAYLWGKPDVIGNRTNINITQTFDFPTAYRFKKQISDIQNDQVELEYKKLVKSLLLETRLVCYDLIYLNAMKSELTKRLIHAQSIADSYKSKFEIGETNILEYNKAQLNLLKTKKELEILEIDRHALYSSLTGLNGGNDISFNDSIFQSNIIPEDFDKWYTEAEQNNPILIWLKQEIEKSQNQEKLSGAMNLPKLHAGYMNESLTNEQFQGITFGISVPLWENKNTLKYAKAKTYAVESILADNKLQFYIQLKTLHTKAVSLQKSVSDYRSNLSSFDNSELLKKALDKGEINLIDYIMELSIYYENVNQLLETEKELNNTLAELNKYM